MNADDLLPRPLDDYLAAADAEQFPGLRPGAVRLDSPAGTLVHAAVRDGIADYLGGPMVSNDGEPFPASRHSDELAAWARGRVAALLGAPAGEVLFGPNMTTLTSMFVRAVEAGVRPGDEIVCTELDHEANSAPWRAMAERRGAVVRTARTRDGRLPAEAVAELLTPRTRWVAVTAASNALGTVTDPAAIAAAAAGSGARMFVDAVQAVPHFPVDAAAWSADAVVVSAYKWYGPHLGALWVSEAAAEEAVLPEQPPSAGTALPGRLETGTLGFEQILGTGIAAEMLLRRDRAADAAREERTAAAIVSALRRIPGVRLVAPPEPGERRVPVVAFRIDGVPADKAAAALAEEGIAVTHGTLYAAAAMRAAAPDGPEALRAGVSLYTTERDAARLAGAVGGLAGRPADRKG